MEVDTHQSGLIIRFRGNEWTPDHKTRYMAFWARHDDYAFAGETEFETTERVIQHFVEELQVFYHDLSNQPHLRCGSGDNVYFDWKFSQFDKRGGVLMSCAISANSVHNHLNTVRIHRRIELARIDEIRSFFQIILTHEEPIEMTGL